MLRRIVFIFILLSAFVSHAQVESDSLSYPEETAVVDTTKKKKGWTRPQKTMLMSAVLPGLGQVYSGKTYWWKLPIIYGGFTVIYIFYNKNQVPYAQLDEWYDFLAKPENSEVEIDYFYKRTGFRYTSLSQIKADRDNFRRYRDMSIFFGISLYALNIMDAYVEAHLLDFDISEDLSMKIRPVFLSQNNVSFTPGIGLQLNFKNSRAGLYR